MRAEMTEHIQKLRICFQKLGKGYLLEQGKLRDMLKSMENKCNELVDLHLLGLLSCQITSLQEINKCLQEYSKKLTTIQSKILDRRRKSIAMENLRKGPF